MTLGYDPEEGRDQRRLEAAREVASVDPEVWDEIGQTLTCGEYAAFRTLLAMYESEDAIRWLDESHQRSDIDPGDCMYRQQAEAHESGAHDRA